MKRAQKRAPWLEIAYRELGEHEIAGPAANARIVEYLSTVDLPARYATTDETAWCAAFVCWALHQARVDHPGKPLARSFLNWGTPVVEPANGDLVVLRRGSSRWQGHVGFFVGFRGGHVLVLGGNQGDQVSIASFPTSLVLGYRRPRMVK